MRELGCNAAMTLPDEIRDGPLCRGEAAGTAHDVVIVTDANGNPMWANEALGTLADAALCGKGFRSDPITDRRAGDAIVEALNTRQPVKIQVCRRKESGEPLWYDLEVSPVFDASSRLGGYVAIQRNITNCVERSCDRAKSMLSSSKAEGRLQAAIEAASDGFAIYDERDRLLIANKAFHDLHKGAGDATAPGVSFEELLRASVSAGLVDLGCEDTEQWAERQLSAAQAPAAETHVKYAQGGWTSLRHKRMENGETVRIWTNINALKREQGKLEAARLRAEAADQAKSRFLANVSHELRTPMNGIAGFNELLLATDLTERQREYAMLIQSSSQSLISLIDEILDLGKIERGAIEIEALPFKLSELIAAVRALEPLAESKGLRLQIECALPLETIVVGDQKRIRQVLVNLAGNAIKFTDKGAVSVSISREQNGLQFVVQDTGRGISPERQESIFERFHQGHEPGMSKVQGNGLGLAITKELVGLMGGGICLDSEPGRGSTFKVRLPLWVDAEKAQEHPRESAPAPLSAAPFAYKVLIAEDHPINLKLALALLKAAGCEADCAQDGRQALAKLEKGEYDLIVMDTQMPGMTGIEAMKAIRRRSDWKQQVPILSLTADAMKGAEEYHALAGADAYMSKPLRSDAFIDTARRLGERGRALRETHADEDAPKDLAPAE